MNPSNYSGLISGDPVWVKSRLISITETLKGYRLSIEPPCETELSPKG